MDTDFHHIQLNEHQRHLLANAADHLGVPWPEVSEKAIAPLAENSQTQKENGKAETPYEILLREGLIGCIESTPRELSTNKKYMLEYGKNG
ncbi:MAG TPA: hypothetical protein VFW73_10225 [Lacipirellulaceae bacterium]|nr:hypothetical protein [Lacipirellulaceae bacterium]